MTQTKQRRYTMAEIKAHNKRAGYFFFSRDTMRFFASRVESAPYSGLGGVYFITSEKGGFTSTTRRYTVRVYNPETGECDTHGDFNKFIDVEDAREAARKAARGNN